MNCLEETPGIGPKTSMLLNKLGINSIDDLIQFYPKKYNVIKRSDMDNVSNGDKVIILNLTVFKWQKLSKSYFIRVRRVFFIFKKMRVYFYFKFVIKIFLIFL